MPQPIAQDDQTFLNPVYDRSFPDPFILRFAGEYYGYCTGQAGEGRVFGVLRSTDLVHWDEMPGAMEPLSSAPPFYWAPEVTYSDGKFYLYYSAGNEVNMELRVAVADEPGGPFVDAGHRLTNEDFAIDPHVFRDDDGAWIMFYATDFLGHSNIGTGTVMDRMSDPFTLQGSPRPVTRAKYDWQVYDPARREKGGVRWHTVEGPFVLERKKRYFEMFSGGNWQNMTYGVSFAVSDDLDNGEEWLQVCDGAKVLPILRTIPDHVIGPGHNSVVKGPNGLETYCVYHRWQDGHRVLCMDRMDFAGPERLFVAGPSYKPQHLPFEPRRRPDRKSDGWSGNGTDLISTPGERRELTFDVNNDDFHLEIWSRPRSGAGQFGLAVDLGPGRKALNVIFDIGKGEVTADDTAIAASGKSFKIDTFHELQIEAIGRQVTFLIDGRRRLGPMVVADRPLAVSVFTDDAEVEFRGICLTRGFEELFLDEKLEKRGWTLWGPESRIKSTGTTLRLASDDDQIVSLSRPIADGDFELTINFRIEDLHGDGGMVFLAGDRIFTIETADHLYMLADGQRWVLPSAFDAAAFHQIRFLRSGKEITVYLEGEMVGSTYVAEHRQIEVAVTRSVLELDMVRYTRLTY